MLFRSGGKLLTELPPEEALKPLRRIVIDLAEKKKTVTDLKSKDQQIRYIGELKASDRPDLSRKSGVATPVEAITDKDFTVAPAPKAKKTRAARTAARTTVVPKSCRLIIPAGKSSSIHDELKTLRLAKHVHAIGVL